MKKFIEKIRDSKYLELLFEIGLCLYCFKVTYSSSTLIVISSTIASLLYKLAFVFMIPKIIFQKYQKNERIVAVIFFAVGLYRVYCYGSLNIILLAVSLIGIKGSDIKKITKLLFAVEMSCIISHVLAFFIINIANGSSFLSLLTFNRDVVRNDVYFREHNSFAIRTVCSIILYIYFTNRDDKRYLKTFILTLYALFIFALSQSRTSFIISLLVILYMLIEKNNFIKNNINVIKIVVFIFSIAFSIFMIYADLNNEFVFWLNDKLTGRIYLCEYARKIVGWSLLPNVEKFEAYASSNYVDNYYIGSLFGSGILLSLFRLVCLIYFGFMQKNEEAIDYLMTVMFIWSITESILSKVVLYAIPLIAVNIYFKKNNEN